jgi:DNA-binding response OmpR family regulator
MSMQQAEVRVLVADDDEALLDLMARRVERLGFHVDRAADGQAAMSLIQLARYDLIVADIYMPEATGLDLMVRARELDPDVQVIVATASANLDNAIEALNQGAFAYLTKPFDHLTIFDRTVERALEHRRLVLDHRRMADVQKRRGDMLEDEVAERIHQAQRKQREMVELLSCLPLGVVVVEDGGRILLTNPLAEQWLASEVHSGVQPIRDFLTGAATAEVAEPAEIEVGRSRLRLTARKATDGNGRRRYVVVLQETGEQPLGQRTQVSDALTKVKRALARLDRQSGPREFAHTIHALTLQVLEIERMLGLTVGPGVNAVLPSPPDFDDIRQTILSAEEKAGLEAPEFDEPLPNPTGPEFGSPQPEEALPAVPPPGPTAPPPALPIPERRLLKHTRKLSPDELVEAGSAAQLAGALRNLVTSALGECLEEAQTKPTPVDHGNGRETQQPVEAPERQPSGPMRRTEEEPTSEGVGESLRGSAGPLQWPPPLPSAEDDHYP